MIRRDAFIACIAAVLAALAGAYFLGRANAPPPLAAASSASAEPTGGVAADAPPLAASGEESRLAAKKGASLPNAGTPLRQTFAELQARAAAGDAAAAARLFRDLDQCKRSSASQWRNAAALNELTNAPTEDLRPEQLRTRQMLLEAMELRQQSAHAVQDLCAGVDEAMLGATVASLAQAARLGDKDARACYLDRGPLYDARGLLARPQSLQTYRQQAQEMIRSGLAAGDWRVVDLLRQAYEPGAQNLLAGLVGADPVQHYRYLKLYRLGAEPHRAAALDRQLGVAAANLAPAQRAQADQWAQEMRRDRFSGDSTRATPPGWDACAF
ncbi:MAG TPA: hypothetical protein VJ806_04085 [Luteimonas sp.]|nr:hypothetical protein [Luteimonas sp.]